MEDAVIGGDEVTETGGGGLIRLLLLLLATESTAGFSAFDSGISIELLKLINNSIQSIGIMND